MLILLPQWGQVRERTSVFSCTSLGDTKSCHIGTFKADAIFSNVDVVKEPAETICLTADNSHSFCQLTSVECNHFLLILLLFSYLIDYLLQK